MKKLVAITTILVLMALPVPAPSLAQAPSCEFDYTVQAGDWLSRIAEKYYSDVLAYPTIVEANNAQADDAYTNIADPDLIEPGWLLCIPPDGEASAELVDTIWRWDQTVMNNDEIFVPDNPNNHTLQFLPNGTVSIQADCNRVGGTYTVEASTITIETGMTTLALCPPGSLGDQFVAQLNAAAIYFIEGQNLFLDLQFDSGTMQFTAQSNELVGTSWVVTRYNNGRQGVVSVIIGTEMTATFSEDGQLTGSAGCNDYFADYTTEGSNIRIGPAGATQQFCSEPAGIMEQEQLYLAALQTAATYSIRGDTLDLRTAAGARSAAFRTAD